MAQEMMSGLGLSALTPTAVEMYHGRGSREKFVQRVPEFFNETVERRCGRGMTVMLLG